MAQTKMRTEVKFQLARKAKKKPINYFRDFQQADKLKCQLLIVLGVPILVCFVINTVLNGWWILIKINKV